MSPTLRRPVRVEFVGIMPTLFAHCEHCMEVMHGTGLMPYSEQLEEYPEDVKKQYFQLSEVAQKIRDEFGGGGLFVGLYTGSPPGVWVAVRDHLPRHPRRPIEG